MNEEQKIGYINSLIKNQKLKLLNIERAIERLIFLKYNLDKVFKMVDAVWEDPSGGGYIKAERYEVGGSDE